MSYDLVLVAGGASACAILAAIITLVHVTRWPATRPTVNPLDRAHRYVDGLLIGIIVLTILVILWFVAVL